MYFVKIIHDQVSFHWEHTVKQMNKRLDLLLQYCIFDWPLLSDDPLLVNFATLDATRQSKV